MTNNVKKYGLMTIAAVLLVAMAFAGAASADSRVIDNLDDYLTNFSSSSLPNTDTIYYIKDGVYSWIIPSLHNGTEQLVINSNVTLDFTNFTGSNFAGILTIDSVDKKGALFGNININDKTLEIVGLNLTSVNVLAGGQRIAGIIGSAEGSGTMNFTNCHLQNCSINTSGDGRLGAFVGWAGSANMNIYNCSVLHCDMVAPGNSVGVNVGGFVGRVKSVNFEICTVANSTVVANKSSVGGLVGNADSVSLAYSNVENSMIYTGNTGNAYAGGISGYIGTVSRSAWNNVTNCIVATTADSDIVGGMFGHVTTSVNTLIYCNVTNCTVGGDHDIGGIVGYTDSASDCHNNTVTYCGVRGNTNVGLAFGWKTSGSLGWTGDMNKNYVQDGAGTYPDTIRFYNLSRGMISMLDTSLWKTACYTTGNSTRIADNAVLQITYVGKYGAVDGYGAYLPVYTVTYDGNSAPSGEVPQSQRDLAGTIITVADKSTLAKMGYNFTGWNFGTTTGELKQPRDKFALTANTTLYANWTVNTTTVTAYGNGAEFGNENITAIHSTSGVVVKVLLNDLVDVEDTAVVFTADNNSLDVPDLNGYTKVDGIAVFEINASVADDVYNYAVFWINVTFADAATATANKDKIEFSHYNTQNNAWDKTPLTFDYEPEQDGAVVMYYVRTTSFSPFGIGIYTAIPQQYTPSSSSKHSGSTVILSEGQVAPTAYATAAPTVAPTVKPTEKPATPTVIATAKPTTQPTQASPAPFVGLLAGLGAAAVLLRLRK